MRAALLLSLVAAGCGERLVGPRVGSPAALIFAGAETFAVAQGEIARLPLADGDQPLYAAMLAEPLSALGLASGPVIPDPEALLPIRPVELLTARSPRALADWAPAETTPEVVSRFRVVRPVERLVAHPPVSYPLRPRLAAGQRVLYALELGAPAVLLARACDAVDLELLGPDGVPVSTPLSAEGCVHLNGLVDPDLRLEPDRYLLAARAPRETDASIELELRARETWGNGLREGLEECDDGDVKSGDGCSTTCEIEPARTITGPPIIAVLDGDLPEVGVTDTFRVVSRGTSTLDVQVESCRTAFTFALYEPSGREVRRSRMDGCGATWDLNDQVYSLEVRAAALTPIPGYSLRLSLN